MDKLIDLASAPPRGTGVQNIREIIIENKMTFDVSSDDWQVFLKNKIMNNIERYFYLIVFAMYVRETGPKLFPQTFKEWMDAHDELRYYYPNYVWYLLVGRLMIIMYLTPILTRLIVIKDCSFV